jgi:hypothetical protein
MLTIKKPRILLQDEKYNIRSHYVLRYEAYGASLIRISLAYLRREKNQHSTSEVLARTSLFHRQKGERFKGYMCCISFFFEECVVYPTRSTKLYIL